MAKMRLGEEEWMNYAEQILKGLEGFQDFDGHCKIRSITVFQTREQHSLDNKP